MVKKILLSFISILYLTVSYVADANAMLLSDSAKISIITKSPSPDNVYSVFGHTMLRIQDDQNNYDVSFNYGVFDFDSPGFTWRFVTGETDYWVEGYRTRYVLADYKERGIEIREQVLNLTQSEKQKIFEAMIWNIQPSNKIYRYNFFYDNCATRPRDIIISNVDGKINFAPTNKVETYRDLVHECVDQYPWLRFGIDLVIGADADLVITDRQKDFLPLYLYQALHNSTIERNDSVESFIVEDKTLFSGASTIENSEPIDTPLIVGILCLIAIVLFTIWIVKTKRFKLAKLFDTALFVFAGSLGCVICFLMFCSTHPCVGSNWNIVWLNPLMLIMGLLFFVKPLAKCVFYYHFINFVALLVFLLAWLLIPQSLEIAFIPYILILLIRSMANIFIFVKK